MDTMFALLFFSENAFYGKRSTNLDEIALKLYDVSYDGSGSCD